MQVKHRKDVRLYYGTFNKEKTAYLDQVSSWEAQGISITHVYSDDGQGYVQDAFDKVSTWPPQALPMFMKRVGSCAWTSLQCLHSPLQCMHDWVRQPNCSRL